MSCSAASTRPTTAALSGLQDRGGTLPNEMPSAQQRLKAVLTEDRQDAPPPGSQIREGHQVYMEFLANSSCAATSRAHMMLHTHLLMSLVLSSLLLRFVHTYTFSVAHVFGHLIAESFVRPLADVSHHAGCGYCHISP